MEFMKLLLNLPDRKDRLKESIDEFKKVNIGRVDVFPAIKTPQHGLHGCLLSHLYMLGICKQNKRHAMIFEDDIKFVPEFDEVLNKSLQDLNELDWNMFYMGGNICGPMYPVTDNLAKLTWAQSTHAYCVNYNFIDTLLLNIPIYFGTPLDLIYATKIIPNSNSYIVMPKLIALQRKSFSDIEGGIVEYESWMQKRYDENLQKPLTN